MLPDLNTDKHTVKLQMESNAISCESSKAVEKVHTKEWEVDSLCMLGSDTYLQQGRTYKLHNKAKVDSSVMVVNPLKVLEWKTPTQFNFFVSSPVNSIELSIIL